MTRDEFRKLIESKLVILDGATGSNLQNRGMPVGTSPEQWMLENPDIVISLQREFLEAGSDIILAPTFTANRIKLKGYGMEERIEEINQGLVSLSRKAIEEYRSSTGSLRKVYVAADLTMTGASLAPIGNLTFDELVDVYKEQLICILSAGVDLVVVETMMSLQECRAALLAVKESCELPVMISLTYTQTGRTLYGTDPETAVIVLQNMGADAIGVNCSTGPKQMVDIVERMKRVAHVPIMAKPNAGIPKLVEDKTVFPMNPEEFTDGLEELVAAGANLVGGCCGTTPSHLQRMVEQVSKFKPKLWSEHHIRALTTQTRTLPITLDGRFLLVGERINPTGKKALQEELRQGKLDIILTMAEEQAEQGAEILDLNLGMNGIDEKERMLQVMEQVMQLVDIPLCIDSSHIDVIEAALRLYPGRALINSISLEKSKAKALLPIAKKYGAMFILLPLSEHGLPKDIEEKKQIIHRIIDMAADQGLTKEDIIVDGLVNTIGANKNAALEALETIRYCKNELEMATIIGLSNISFGLPQRQYINSTFLTLAIREGLTMAIANPSQELPVNTALATDLLLAKQGATERYIEEATKRPVLQSVAAKHEMKEESAHEEITQDTAQNPASAVYEAVVKGNKKIIIALVQKELEQGVLPGQLIDQLLIPAINEVGRLYDKQIYFLPQLIAGAETMKAAIDYLEPMLERSGQEHQKGTIIIATVSGDIHDIGKNLVTLMLKNYGYRVIDLGKDVPTDVILQTAREEAADIIALSALMTTTMVEMKRVVEKVREERMKAKVIIGGAVITESYADEIGADGYSEDAQSAVKLVQRLLS